MYASPLGRKLLRPATIARARRSGTGLGLSPDELLQDPTAKSYWDSIESQLTSEGNPVTSLAVVTAKDAFAKAYTDLTGPGGILENDTMGALGSAKDLIIAGSTIGGAVNHVQGLLSAAQGGDTVQVFQLATGTLIGLAASTGVLTAGVGAVIVAGLGAALSFMQQAGLFGADPKGVGLPGCGNAKWDPPPTIAVGCMAMLGASSDPYGGAVKSGSAYWRKFPKPSGGNPNDDKWYGPPTGATTTVFPFTFTWAGSASGPSYTWGGYGGPQAPRAIDVALPDYHYLNCQTVPAGLEAFAQAFSMSWVANKEYEFNGLKSQPDAAVLDNLLRVWNVAHDGSSYVDLGPATKGNLYSTSNPAYWDAYGKLHWPCPGNLPPLFQTVIAELIANPSAATAASLAPGGTKIRIHTGSLKTPPKKHLDLHLGTAPPPSDAAVRAQRATTVALVAGGTVAAVAAGGTLYAFFTNQGIGYFWGKVFDGAIEGGKALVGLRE